MYLPGHYFYFIAVRPKAPFHRFTNGRFYVYHRGMKNTLLALLLTIATAFAASGQTPKPADPKDVGSMDAIMKAIYDVISGEKGKPRDWDRFRSLFHPDGRLIPSGKNR